MLELDVLLYGLPLAFLAGFVDAIAGGGGVINFVTNLAAVTLFLFAGQMIFWLGLTMGVANALGAQLGAHMAMLRGSQFVKVIYVGIVGAVAARLLLVR